LTRQLLTFSRRQVLQPRPIDLSTVVSGMEPMLRRLIDAKIECRTDLEASRQWVMADPTQIEQVLLNLVLNARDAMLDGGSIVIETRQVEIEEGYAAEHPDTQAGQHMLLSVSDTGTGMDAEVQARVFEPFFTTKAAGRGTGLGLSTVHSIVRQSGGSLRLRSEKGRGTTFEVFLPCIDEPVDVMPDDRLETTLSDPRPLSILVVDDDDAVRRAATRALERAGHAVLTASNGREALAVTSDPLLTIDLVISDLVMPDLSGWDLGAELTVRRPGSRLLFMSGYTTQETGRRMPLIGDGFLQKPFTPDSLIEHVRLAMRTR
jgi:two-component system cell cycle sensor histidine kinase/response regulator CckA